MAKSKYLKELTKEKARRAMLPMLVGQLVGAEHNELGTGLYGIVVDWSLIETYMEAKPSDPYYDEWKTKVWAIWCKNKLNAIQAYEKATELELRPRTAGGLLTSIDPSEYQFELLDLTGNE